MQPPLPPATLQDAALEFWAAETPEQERVAYAWMRWMGAAPFYGEPPDPQDPPGWSDLTNVR